MYSMKAAGKMGYTSFVFGVAAVGCTLSGVSGVQRAFLARSPVAVRGVAVVHAANSNMRVSGSSHPSNVGRVVDTSSHISNVSGMHQQPLLRRHINQHGHPPSADLLRPALPGVYGAQHGQHPSYLLTPQHGTAANKMVVSGYVEGERNTSSHASPVRVPNRKERRMFKVGTNEVGTYTYDKNRFWKSENKRITIPHSISGILSLDMDNGVLQNTEFRTVIQMMQQDHHSLVLCSGEKESFSWNECINVDYVPGGGLNGISDKVDTGYFKINDLKDYVDLRLKLSRKKDTNEDMTQTETFENLFTDKIESNNRFKLEKVDITDPAKSLDLFSLLMALTAIGDHTGGFIGYMHRGTYISYVQSDPADYLSNIGSSLINVQEELDSGEWNGYVFNPNKFYFNCAQAVLFLRYALGLESNTWSTFFLLPNPFGFGAVKPRWSCLAACGKEPENWLWKMYEEKEEAQVKCGCAPGN